MDSRNGENRPGVEVPRDKKVNIETFYLIGETDIWWNTVKNRLLGPDFTWSRFVEELTTMLRIAKWELTNARDTIAQSTSLLPVPEGSQLQEGLIC